MAMCRIQHNRLISSRISRIVTQTQSICQRLLGFLIVLLLIVDNSDFIVDHRITIIDSHRFLERHESSLETIEFEVLHANVERSLVTSREKSVGSAIGIHRLVSLIESSKCMSKCNPAGSKMLV